MKQIAKSPNLFGWKRLSTSQLFGERPNSSEINQSQEDHTQVSLPNSLALFFSSFDEIDSPQVEVEILLVASCCGNRDKLRPDGPLGSYADLTLHVPHQSQCYINQNKITERQESRVIKSLFFLPFEAGNSYYFIKIYID